MKSSNKQSAPAIGPQIKGGSPATTGPRRDGDRPPVTSTQIPAEISPVKLNAAGKKAEATTNAKTAFLPQIENKIGSAGLHGRGLILWYVQEIQGAWYKGVENIFRLAKLCAEANKRLGTKGKQGLLPLLPFEAATFSKMVKIGDHPTMEKYTANLPSSFSTIYELCLLSEPELVKAIDKGLVHKDVQRSKIVSHRKKSRDSSGRFMKHATISLFDSMNSAAVKEINAALAELRTRYGSDNVQITYHDKDWRPQEEVVESPPSSPPPDKPEERDPGQKLAEAMRAFADEKTSDAAA